MQPLSGYLLDGAYASSGFGHLRQQMVPLDTECRGLEYSSDTVGFAVHMHRAWARYGSRPDRCRYIRPSEPDVQRALCKAARLVEGAHGFSFPFT